MSLHFRPSALFDRDLAAHVRWYREEAGASERVIDGLFAAVDEAAGQLAEWPNSGRAGVGPLEGHRELNLRRPYGAFVLIHRVTPEAVLGTRLFHAKRKRGTAASRRFGGWA